MNFFIKLIDDHKQRVKQRNSSCDEWINRIEDELDDFESIFSKSQDFIDPMNIADLKIGLEQLLNNINEDTLNKLKKAKNYKTLIDKVVILKRYIHNIKDKIHHHNNRIALWKTEEAYDIIGAIEGHKLDEQQMACIIKNTHNHLVIAGAGTGKTTTVVGKVKYLINTKSFMPQDILVLSFTNASASEMNERIQKETKQTINASTFHKLGMDILTKVDGIKPKITKLNLKKFVKEQLDKNMENEEYLSKLLSFLLFVRVSFKSEFDFNTEQEYKEYLKLNPPTTFLGEEVKSYGEMFIANFLMKNNIKYIYEHPYREDTRDENYTQYYPDFYLPEYDVYIEYFAIDRENNVPDYFKSKNGENPSVSYLKSMNWKRDLHNIKGTTMIECYAYEMFEGTLLDELKNKLEKSNIKLKPLSAKELCDKINSNEETTNILNGVIDLFETLINLIKSNDYTISKMKELCDDDKNKKQNLTIIELLEPIFLEYIDLLKQNDEIDFNDMIIKATKYVDDGKYINPFKFVIVDEYQDISKARFKLLESLRNSSNYDLFCVGDDWQSIYRFAGSDISYILNFEKHWGPTEISKIETTYRFAQKLIDISSEFVTQNPSQIKKSIIGKSNYNLFPVGVVKSYTEKSSLQFISSKLDDLPQGASVFFIGRYIFDINPIRELDFYDYKYDNTTGFINIIYKKRRDLNIIFLTAHRSKGLQADYVFIINNKNSKMGFPSKILDHPVLELLLDNLEEFPYSEERRLFYVAMTRAKKKCYLALLQGKESMFANEIVSKYRTEIEHERYECPLCGGTILKKHGKYGDFLGCSNYKSGCRYTKKITYK